jgi:hypothetical protein
VAADVVTSKVQYEFNGEAGNIPVAVTAPGKAADAPEISAMAATTINITNFMCFIIFSTPRDNSIFARGEYE